MQNFFKNPIFSHFLRNWSESIRTILLLAFLGSKQGLFLSTFIFIAENLRKNGIFSLLLAQFLSENTSWNKGLIILFPFIPQSSKNFILVQVAS